MSTPLQITLIAGTLPPSCVYNPQTFLNAFAAQIRGTIPAGNVIWGQLGGSEPTAPLQGNGATSGLWFGNPDPTNDSIWNQWNADIPENSNTGKYMPIPLVCGQYVSGNIVVTEFLCGATDGSFKIITPDKSGTMALLDDLVQALGNQSYSDTTTSVSWKNRQPIYITLYGNTVIAAPTDATDGQIMDFYVENNSGTTDWTIDFPTVFWPQGTAQPQPPFTVPHVAGNRVISHFRIFFAGNLLLGQVIAHGITTTPAAGSPPQAYQIATTVQAGNKPNRTNIVGSKTFIWVQTDFDLIGNDSQGTPPPPRLLVSNWHLVKNGIGATISRVLTTGNNIYVYSADNFIDTDVVTLKYTGNDIKSIANVAMDAWPAPVTVPLVNVAAPSAQGGGGGLFNHYLD